MLLEWTDSAAMQSVLLRAQQITTQAACHPLVPDLAASYHPV